MTAWDGVIPGIIGLLFTGIAAAKFYGLYRGMVGGAGQSLVCQVCGTCPSWRGWDLRVAMPVLFLCVGLWNLTEAARILFRLW